MISIFLGNRIECLRVLQEFTEVEIVVTSKDSRVDFFFRENKKKIIIKKTNILNIFKLIKFGPQNLILSSGFNKIIPKYFIPKDKIIINSHPSLLPDYKGLKPIKDAIRKKSKIIGVTTHLMNERLDSGKIISKKKFNNNLILSSYSIHKYCFTIVEPVNLRNTLKLFVKF